MQKTPWTPWHKVVTLREDIRTGQLSLSVFAADIYDVMMGRAQPVYQEPAQFFALTYPTYNLRELAKDVADRLAGRNDRAVRQLEITYGGGKTHALITLYHLVNNPNGLPDLPAVREFTSHIGTTPPRARVAVLAFDKLDVEKGMEVLAPSGEKRWLKNPWSVLAFQIAGPGGLRLLHPENRDEERGSPPAENLMADLLARPQSEGLSTLVLIDEVLMFAREKVGLDPTWRTKIVDFFQYLTQAATKVERCAVVASLLATDPRKSDALGKEITQEIYAIFRREREEGVQPIQKDDVSEVLRRRFFTPESIRDREAFRSHVVAAIKGIAELDDQARKDQQGVEERFLKSYPFHPDLIDIFYSKWTNLEGFQRTRGILRTFALALREAAKWDNSPLVGVNVFLSEPGKTGIAEAARELTTVAATEEYEGKRQEWTGILEGELAKATEIQKEASGLRFREIEQAVFSVFLHSQPIGQKALTREIMLLLGSTRPDRIEIEKALRRWAEVSWFLDEEALRDTQPAPDGERGLPRAWRLGTRPNLRQMHHDACAGISPEMVNARLVDQIPKVKSLTQGADALGVRVHMLPLRPRDVEDDGDFHYAVLGPKAASQSGKPSAEARRFLDETSGPDKPRVYRNAVVLAVPSEDGLEVARNAVRDLLGWEEVQTRLKDKQIDPIRAGMLAEFIDTARKWVPDAIRQAYCIVATVSEKNEVQAFRVTVGSDPLFTTIKSDARSRIQETAVSADALLPGGPYDLWRHGETSRWVKDLVGAFAQFPQLPKMLNRKAILDTLVAGCSEGIFVLRLVRPDRSVRTFWREPPDDVSLKDPGLEAILPEYATLSDLSADLLAPGVLPGLWSGSEVTVGQVRQYFQGGRVVSIPRDGYEDRVTVPACAHGIVDAAIHGAVKKGRLWLTRGPASVFMEDIPAGLLTDDACLRQPPKPVAVLEIMPEALPGAWSSPVTTALAISVALSQNAGATLPWVIVRDAIDGALRSQLLELTLDSGPWPCDFAGAQAVRLRVRTAKPREDGRSEGPEEAGVLVAEAELRPGQIQDLAENVAAIGKAAAGLELKFRLRVEIKKPDEPAEDRLARINQLLAQVSETLKLRPR